jgi:hypothetical protein
MGKHQRTKGAAFERAIAGKLHALLGITFKRNLSQTQDSGQADLTPSDPDFPFVIECKKRANGNGCAPEWWRQVEKAALSANKYPAVIYAYDRRQPRVAISARAIVECVTRGKWSGKDYIVEIDLEGFAYVAREGLCGNMLPK